MFENRNKKEKGVALYFSLMIAAILLAIAFGLSSILLGQLGTIKAMGNSVVAFYAADAGIEEVLKQRASPSSICTESKPCHLNNEAEYYLDIRDHIADPNCPNFCIKSIGAYRGTNRAIEITY